MRTSRTSQRSAFHASRQLSPVSEIPHPSEIQTMQLEVDILNQELATARRQAGEMERQVASLKREIQQYQRRISRQNHLVAQIAHTIKFFSSDYRVAEEPFQQPTKGPTEMEQVPRQDNGWI
jgi:chromosome segregation ATPase